MTVVQIERRKIEFLVPIDIPEPKHRIGQLVEVETKGYHLALNELRWFPCRVTGMAYSTYQGKNPKWEYQVQFLNCTGEEFEWFSEDEIHLLEDY